MIKKTLKQITTKIGSGATPRGGNKVYQSKGISLIRSQNIHDFKFIYNGLAFINDQQAKELDNVTVEENDILLNITVSSRLSPHCHISCESVALCYEKNSLLRR
jgi:type I restriction enzyme S subunit